MLPDIYDIAWYRIPPIGQSFAATTALQDGSYWSIYFMFMGTPTVAKLTALCYDIESKLQSLDELSIYEGHLVVGVAKKKKEIFHHMDFSSPSIKEERRDRE